MYDLIGDIHGERDTLVAMLKTLGYRDAGGVWAHPERKVIFLGDFIDRGPDARGVCRLARAMVESGEALAVMGNHELNALAFHTPNPDQPGEYLRPHTDKNRRQHQATLASFAGSDSELADTLEWFHSLPLWLELPEGLRAVHAAWQPWALAALRGMLGSERTLGASLLPEAVRKDGALYSAAETVLKGVELPLPGGRTFQDKDGIERHEVRIRWWAAESGRTWRELALGDEDLVRQLPEADAPLGEPMTYPDDAPPVFIGHYWLRGTPKPLTRNVACLDFSVAMGGHLVAYRWDGEQTLDPDRFVALAS